MCLLELKAEPLNAISLFVTSSIFEYSITKIPKFDENYAKIFQKDTVYGKEDSLVRFLSIVLQAMTLSSIESLFEPLENLGFPVHSVYFDNNLVFLEFAHRFIKFNLFSIHFLRTTGRILAQNLINRKISKTCSTKLLRKSEKTLPFKR